jgi:CubicO group peptidase (beta-lactamase class C family)
MRPPSDSEEDRPLIWPGREWQQDLSAASRGWSSDRLAELGRALDAGASGALMVIEQGQIVFQWGAVARKARVASVRKSIISALYGIYVAEGRIDLRTTLADIGIDDIGGLSPLELSATVEHLLQSRSGIYHPAVYDTAGGRPARGSKMPGQHWFYNNWDFNALGTIFERQTGVSVFEALARRLAAPLCMQDFETSDGWYVRGAESRHPVYKLQLSARDLARFGLLYLRGGSWNGAQIVPRRWIGTSTRPHSELGDGIGYGYLWWTASAHATGDPRSIDRPIFYASGYGGQYVFVVPALDLVVVHLVAHVDRGITRDVMGKILRAVRAAMPRT